MGRYLDLEYYKNTFKGNSYNTDDETLESNIRRAELIIDSVTMQKLRTTEPFENLPSFSQELVKDAICLITENFLSEGGYENIVTSSGDSVQSASIGGFSYSEGANTKSNTGSEASLMNYLPATAYELLLSTGLLYRGVGFS